jgi:hypothetical protein
VLNFFVSKIASLTIEMGLADMRRKIATWNLQVSAMVIPKYFIRSKTKGGAIVSAHEGVGMRSKSAEEQRLTAY